MWLAPVAVGIIYDICQAYRQDFVWGSAYLNNWEQVVNIGVKGHASAEDTKLKA